MSRPSCDERCEQRGKGCFFQVAWSINPHMVVGSADGRAAVAEHDNLAFALRVAGARVIYVPFVHGAFDSVFSKDNALIADRGDHVEALLARPRHSERAAEQNARAAAYRELGFDVHLPSAPLEGGDTVMVPGSGDVFLGHGFRSTSDAAHDLERFTHGTITQLELRDPRLYHLDMALSILEDGTALACLEALTPASQKKLLKHPCITDVIAVPLAEALRFGVNLVQIGRTIVWGANAPSTSRALTERGYLVRRVSLEQFHRAGGSAACLVSRVHALAAIEELGPESRAA